jgi:hypothetical protein
MEFQPYPKMFELFRESLLEVIIFGDFIMWKVINFLFFVCFETFALENIAEYLARVCKILKIANKKLFKENKYLKMPI